MTIIDPSKKVALCSDHAGYELKCIIEGYLQSQGIEFEDFGTYSTESCDYPDFAHAAACAVESGKCYPGIAVCGTGNGISMSLNKHAGIRAALCWDSEIAKMARLHNDANVLSLPGRYIEPQEALKAVEVFLSTPFEGGRHQRRVEKIPFSGKC